MNIELLQILYLKKLKYFFHNGSNNDYHFVIKEHNNIKDNLQFTRF